ncbi:winged helix-turn-helix domain-containing protein [Polymorphospora sp. NPDC050346]|uniref:winged helix-turn-helix domain-containing protein n=1 Tax=Polymorphospora sp. NPDC050346 TaxID=3155780 RepID=UPI003401C74D
MPVLRIHFSGDDIARTRVAPAADPLWELILSVHLFQTRTRDPVVAGWRGEVARALRQEARGTFQLLFALNPPRGYFPDFLTPYASAGGIEAGLDAIRSTPVAQLDRDLNRLAAEGELPPGTAGVAGGDTDALHHLIATMRRYDGLAVTPYRARVQTAVEADRARRARALLDGGAEGLLASYRPTMRWEGGVLEVPDYPADRDLHLNGRGLLLVPSFFCARTPVGLLDPDLPPVLVYPVDRLGGILPGSGEGGTVPGRPDGRGALGALLGHTRAAVLAAVHDGCSTGEVARRLGISPAAASQHASVLREAGLLVSHRDRNTVLHTLTPLGRAILNGH